MALQCCQPKKQEAERLNELIQKTQFLSIFYIVVTWILHKYNDVAFGSHDGKA